MAISAKNVKALREKTGVGMMDCKKALTETDGDVDKAVDVLRKQGLAKGAKRADRSNNAGLVRVLVNGKELTVFEMLCETDFVAKNDGFIEMTDTLAKMVQSDVPESVDTFKTLKYLGDETKSVDDVVAEALSRIGESIKIGRYAKIAPTADIGELAYYIHTGDTLAVVIDFGVEKAETLENDIFKTVAHDICLHTAAAAPQYLTSDEVPAEIVDKEKEIYMEEAKAAGKPEQILEKIATGKLNKFYKDNCLVKQDFVKDNDLSIEALLANASKETGDTITIKGFNRYQIGE
jgi:elongation factor Ts